MALTKVLTGGLAADSVDNTILKLDDDYALTGAVTGATPITHLDQWRLTTAFGGTAQPIASNLERVDTGGQGTIGSAMTVSSGIFTFPVTGIWLVKFLANLSRAGDSRYQTIYIEATTNNSSYASIGQSNSNVNQSESGRTYVTNYAETTVDVTNVTNVKVRFSVTPSQSDVLCHGDSTYNSTSFTFIRLGDT